MPASKDDQPPSVSPGATDANDAAAGEAAEPGRGRQAHTSTQIPPAGWWDVLRRTIQQLGEDNLSIVAAGVAFYSFMAMVPALAALVSIYALVTDPASVTRQIETMARMLPEETRPLLHDQLVRLTSDDTAAGWGAVLGIGIALFGAMKAMSALITGLNIAYDETERRGVIRLYLTAFILTLAGIVGAIVVMTLVTVLPTVLRALGIDHTARIAVSILRWPLLVGLFMFALSVVYRYAACRDKPRWRWVSWGAGAASVLWLLGSGAFSLYLSKFGDYEGTYGSLGAVVAFLMWLFLTAYVVLLGAELDAEMERQTVKDTTDGPEEPMGKRGAHAADTLGAAMGKKSAQRG